jgi:hypothetical protein
MDSVYDCLKQLDIWINGYNKKIEHFSIDCDKEVILQGNYIPLDSRILSILKTKRVDISMFASCRMLKEGYNKYGPTKEMKENKLTDVEADIIRGWLLDKSK